MRRISFLGRANNITSTNSNNQNDFSRNRNTIKEYHIGCRFNWIDSFNLLVSLTSNEYGLYTLFNIMHSLSLNN